jgi:hypothetical protein
MTSSPMTTKKKHKSIVPAEMAAANSALLNPRTRDPAYMIAQMINPQRAEQKVYPSVLMATVPALTCRPMMKMLFRASPMKLQADAISANPSTQARISGRIEVKTHAAVQAILLFPQSSYATSAMSLLEYQDRTQ